MNSIAACRSAIESSRAHEDPDYPRFHVAPPVGRLNDPNGLIYKDGTYHVFHQLGPFFPTRKVIYWGHCSSTDLTHWDQHSPALAPDDWYDRNGVYSGGATAVGDNVWLHYTGNVKEEDGSRGSYQCAATTSDFKTFTKLDSNPLIAGPPPGYTAHIRDPFIVEGADSYTMYLGAQREDLTGCVLAYASPDLANWELLGELEVSDPRYQNFGYMWECPNVLTVQDEDSGETFDVLLFSPQGIPAQEDQFRNIFACGYLIGHLRGTAFTPVSDFIELDAGFEFYAPQVFSFPKDSPRPPLLMGWVGNASEDDQPSLHNFGWIHTLSVARELRLRQGRLYQTPLLEATDEDEVGGEGERTSAATPNRLSALSIAGAPLGEEPTEIPELAGERSFVLDLDIVQEGPWQLTLGRPNGPQVVLEFAEGRMTVDRSTTHYPHGNRRTVPLPEVDKLDVKVVHDRSVTEIFVGEGHIAFSMRSYLDPDGFQVTLAGNAKVEKARYVTL